MQQLFRHLWKFIKSVNISICIFWVVLPKCKLQVLCSGGRWGVGCLKLTQKKWGKCPWGLLSGRWQYNSLICFRARALWLLCFKSTAFMRRLVVKTEIRKGRGISRYLRPGVFFSHFAYYYELKKKNKIPFWNRRKISFCSTISTLMDSFHQRQKIAVLLNIINASRVWRTLY